MPRLIVPNGELTGSLARGAEARIIAAATSAVGGQLIYIKSVIIEYELVPYGPHPEVVPNVDPFSGYGGTPNDEGTRARDDATGHVTRTHITALPSWGNPDGRT